MLFRSALANPDAVCKPLAKGGAWDRKAGELDRRLRAVVDLLSQARIEDAERRLQEAAAALSDEEKNCLYAAVQRLNQGEFSGAASKPLQPIRESLDRLCGRIPRPAE